MSIVPRRTDPVQLSAARQEGDRILADKRRLEQLAREKQAIEKAKDEIATDVRDELDDEIDALKAGIDRLRETMPTGIRVGGGGKRMVAKVLEREFPELLHAPSYPTRAAAEAARVHVHTTAFRTLGYAAPGDGGGAVYVEGDGNSPGGFFSQGGRGWELAERGVQPLAFGVSPLGVIDSTAALQTALDFAATRGYDTVVLPYGRFLISGDGITIPAGVSMHGAGMAQTRLIYDGTGTAITWESTKDLATSEQLPHVGSCLSDFSLWQKTGTQIGIGIWWKHATRSHLIRVGIKNFARGVDLSGASWSSSIDQCWIALNAVGIYVGGTDSAYVKAEEVGFTTLLNSGFNGGLIQRNEIQGNNIGIYMPYFAAVGASQWIAHGLTISKNIIEGQQKNGIVWSQHQGGLVVAENYFELNCQASTIDPAVAALALTDDVREYKAVICQDLPTINRSMMSPVFRGNLFASHAANVHAFYHDRAGSSVGITYEGNKGHIPGPCVIQRYTDFNGFGFLAIQNTLTGGATIQSSQLQYCTLISNGLYGDFAGGDQTGVFRGLRIRGPVGDDFTTLATNADATLTPGSTGGNVRHTGTLTADRTLTLSTTGAIEGQRFRITRTGGGAFKLNIGTGPLAALSQNEWAEVVYDGAAWVLAARGETFAELRQVATRTALKALSTTDYAQAYLSEAGREGTFAWRSGDYTTQHADDTQEGVYVKATAIASNLGSWVRVFDGPHDLRWYGLKAGAGNGAANATALAAALRSNRRVIVPVDGTFEFNGPITFTGLSNFSLSGTGFGTIFKLMTNTDGMIFDDCQRYTISDFGWTSDTAVVLAATSNLLVLTGSQGVGKILRNQFSAVSGNGLRCAFDSTAPASSFRIEENLFLSCGVAAGAATGAAAFYAEYMNDSWVVGNQFGNVGLVGPRATIGSHLFNSKAGNYEGNYHWENDIGCVMNDCDYSRIIGNRFETNQKAGLEVSATRYFIFANNTLHTNSKLASGSYNHVNFFDCDYAVVSNNNMFEWTSGVTLVNYCMTFDANCSNIQASGNVMSGYAGAAPVASSAVELRLTDNMPQQIGVAEAYGTWLPANGSIAAGATLYISPLGSAAAEADIQFPVPAKCSTKYLRVETNAAPGAAQSYTFTVRKGGVDTAMVATITGAASFSANVGTIVAFNQNDNISVKVVATAGAAAAKVRLVLWMSG